MYILYVYINKEDQNNAYKSVSLFWNVSDHLTKIHTQFIEK